MQLVLVAASNASRKLSSVSVPDHHENTKDRNTPTTAASVADAKPP